jgi:hypothetical protein
MGLARCWALMVRRVRRAELLMGWSWPGDQAGRGQVTACAESGDGGAACRKQSDLQAPPDVDQAAEAKPMRGKMAQSDDNVTSVEFSDASAS